MDGILPIAGFHFRVSAGKIRSAGVMQITAGPAE
jgi:hypothetical protein